MDATNKSGNSAPGFDKYPDYTVAIEPAEATLLVRWNDRVVAESRSALAVQESRHHPVWYIPKADVDDALLAPSETSTYCPFKGHASYAHLVLPESPEERVDDALWFYDDPYDECLALKGYVSFYANKVQVEVDGDRSAAPAPGFIRR